MQRWFSRSPLEGTKQDLSLCPCKKHTEEQSHGTCVRFQWQPLQSCSDEHRWGKTPCKTVLFRGYSLLPPVKATPTVQLVFCPQWQHLSCLLPLEQLYYLLPNSKPSHVITNKDLSVKSAPDGHSCWSCWRLLYPLALLVHSNSVFCYLDGKDISALPLCKSRMEGSRALIYCCWSPDWSSSISGWFFAQNPCYHCYIFIPLHLPGCSSQASWTNTSQRHRWDTILMLSVKIYLCTDYIGRKPAAYNGNCWFNSCRSAGWRGQKLLYSKGNYALKLALFQHRQ